MHPSSMHCNESRKRKHVRRPAWRPLGSHYIYTFLAWTGQTQFMLGYSLAVACAAFPATASTSPGTGTSALSLGRPAAKRGLLDTPPTAVAMALAPASTCVQAAAMIPIASPAPSIEPAPTAIISTAVGHAAAAVSPPAAESGSSLCAVDALGHVCRTPSLSHVALARHTAVRWWRSAIAAGASAFSASALSSVPWCGGGNTAGDTAVQCCLGRSRAVGRTKRKRIPRCCSCGRTCTSATISTIPWCCLLVLSCN